MALIQLSSLPIYSSSIAIQSFQRNFPFLATKNFICPSSSTRCKSLIKVSTDSQTVQSSSSSVYQDSVWHYDYIQSLSNEYKTESCNDQIGVLKKEVRAMFSTAANNLDQIELIDVLQRLGVAYHFKDEIRNILDNNYKIETFKTTKDLHTTSLEFRLFRQHGYNISSDVFNSFIDKTGNFKDVKSLNVEGILSLYEASYHSLEDEAILDGTRDFTSKFLKEYVKETSFGENYISLLIDHALEYPLHWRMPRWEHRWFIEAYERNPNFSPILLRFAKLNFNMLLSIYQEELKDASRWWKSTGLVEKLSFFRDRLVENYIWGLGMNFAPELRYFRTNVAKVNCLITTFDDIYDVHGTLDELELFTEAIERWDLNAMESLPHYMKLCFSALNNFVNDVAYETLKENQNNILPYLRRSWTDLFKSYLKEARWYHSGFTPSFEEYIENSWATIGATTILVNAYFMVPNPSKKENFFISGQYPNMVRYSSMLLRLPNDLGTAKRESVTGDIAKAVENYMNETGVSESDARDHVMSMISSTWKKMDMELHQNNYNYPQSFLDIVENLPKAALFFYQYDDGYTIQDPKTNSRISSILMQPIPMEDLFN